MNDQPPYPVGLRLAGRRVLVVGGGHVVRRRLPGLVAARADILLVAPEVSPSVEANVAADPIRWERRGFRPGDLDGAWYALAAADEPAVNAAVAAEAERRRVFCVRADEAAGGTAWTPATGRHAGVTVAVFGGRDPRRAATVRDAIVDGLRDASLPARHFRHRRAGVALVGGGPGDPGLITVAGRQLLAEADVVVADRLAPRALLDELPADVEIVDAGKIPYGRAAEQEGINRAMVEHARAGRFVVRLKGGDPFVLGRGFEEVLACAEAGISCTVVPGVTSATAVPAIAGIPLTHRGVAQEFTVASGHAGPGSERSLVDWAALARLAGTLVLLMSLERLAEIAKALVDHGRPATTPVAVVQEGSLPDQRVVWGTLGDIADAVEAAGLAPPAIVVVGEVVALAARHATPPE